MRGGGQERLRGRLRLPLLARLALVAMLSPCLSTKLVRLGNLLTLI